MHTRKYIAKKRPHISKPQNHNQRLSAFCKHSQERAWFQSLPDLCNPLNPFTKSEKSPGVTDIAYGLSLILRLPGFKSFEEVALFTVCAQHSIHYHFKVQYAGGISKANKTWRISNYR